MVDPASSSEDDSPCVDETWHTVCATTELLDGAAVVLGIEPPIAVFRVGGDLLATSDTCTHAASSLADGYIDDDVVECLLHGAKFCLRTGAALSFPATQPLRCYPVRAVDGRVEVRV